MTITVNDIEWKVTPTKVRTVVGVCEKLGVTVEGFALQPRSAADFRCGLTASGAAPISPADFRCGS